MPKKPIVVIQDLDSRGNEGILRQRAAEIDDFGLFTQRLVGDLIDTLNSYDVAVGLSAPQINSAHRIAVVNVHKQKGGPPIILINPEITWSSEQLEAKHESCMSIPYYKGSVSRHSSIAVEFFDESGEKHKIDAKGFLARVIQHELDHLNGILYIDRMVDLRTLEHLPEFSGGLEPNTKTLE
jgi:peptide deformylase